MMGSATFKPRTRLGGDAFKQQARVKPLEILFPGGEIRQFNSLNLDDLKEEIVSGNIKRDCKARFQKAGKQRTDKGDSGEERPWSTLEKVSRANFGLRALYRPVWAHIVKWAWFGVIALLVLDAAWLALFWFSFHPKLGLAWAIIAGSSIYSLRAGSPPYFLGGLLVGGLLSIGKYPGPGPLISSTVGWYAISYLLGFPTGMILGTIVGHLRKSRIARAPDAEHEGTKPYLIGLVSPLIFLATVVPLIRGWLVPKLLEWTSRGM